jgi:long-chain acyl-CoA synthetase
MLARRPYVEDIMLHANPFHSKCVALMVVVHSTLKDWAIKPSI